MGQKTKVDQRVHPRHIGAPDAQQIILLARQALRPDHIGQGGHQRGKGKRALGTVDGHLHLHKGLHPKPSLAGASRAPLPVMTPSASSLCLRRAAVDAGHAFDNAVGMGVTPDLAAQTPVRAR